MVTARTSISMNWMMFSSTKKTFVDKNIVLKNIKQFLNKIIMEFDFDRWYLDTFKQYKNIPKIPGSSFGYDDYHKHLSNAGWVINEDNSVTFANDGTINSEVAMNYLVFRKYEKNRDNEKWKLCEKTELLTEYSAWVSAMADKHGRCEKVILEMLKSFNDSVIFSE